jgi:cell division protein FtsA
VAADLAAAVFRMPVRIGAPLPLKGLSSEFRGPEYATAVGLVLEANDRRIARGISSGGGEHAVVENTSPKFFGIFSKLKNWVQNEFF